MEKLTLTYSFTPAEGAPTVYSASYSAPQLWYVSEEFNTWFRAAWSAIGLSEGIIDKNSVASPALNALIEVLADSDKVEVSYDGDIPVGQGPDKGLFIKPEAARELADLLEAYAPDVFVEWVAEVLATG